MTRGIRLAVVWAVAAAIGCGGAEQRPLDPLAPLGKADHAGQAGQPAQPGYDIALGSPDGALLGMSLGDLYDAVYRRHLDFLQFQVQYGTPDPSAAFTWRDFYQALDFLVEEDAARWTRVFGLGRALLDEYVQFSRTGHPDTRDAPVQRCAFMRFARAMDDGGVAMLSAAAPGQATGELWQRAVADLTDASIFSTESFGWTPNDNVLSSGDVARFAHLWSREASTWPGAHQRVWRHLDNGCP